MTVFEVRSLSALSSLLPVLWFARQASRLGLAHAYFLACQSSVNQRCPILWICWSTLSCTACGRCLDPCKRPRGLARSQFRLARASVSMVRRRRIGGAGWIGLLGRPAFAVGPSLRAIHHSLPVTLPACPYPHLCPPRSPVRAGGQVPTDIACDNPTDCNAGDSAALAEPVEADEMYIRGSGPKLRMLFRRARGLELSHMKSSRPLFRPLYTRSPLQHGAPRLMSLCSVRCTRPSGSGED